MIEEEEIEELFMDLDLKEEKTNSVVLNNDLIKYYQANPELLAIDIKSGFFTDEQAVLYRNAIKKALAEENLVNSSNTEMGKKLVKFIPNRNLISDEIKKPLKIAGFVEPLLLGTVVSLLGLLYIGYLYLII